MHVLYLHGFASSAQSSKAAFFASKLRAHSIALHTPDFNEPDFSTLTVTRMIGQVGAAVDRLPGGPVALIGSSLGAFVAVQAALTRQARIDRLVLLAPALDFGPSARSTPLRDFGDRTLEDWQRTNTTNVFHYGYGRVLPLHYALYTDACGYDCLSADLRLPIQVFQGRRDTAVNPEMVEQWAGKRPNVELHMLDDDHQLLGSLDDIWRETSRFLGLTPQA